MTGHMEQMADGTELSYTPERILANPFDYKTSGNMSVSLTNLDYIYTENDLEIPGVNGLDLKINRVFTSAFSYTKVPNGVTTGYYSDSYTLRVKYDAYVSYNGEDYNLVADLSGYTILDGNINALARSYRDFVSADYLSAVDCKSQYLSYVSGWVFGARDADGDVAMMKLNPTIEAIGNFDEAFQNVSTDYCYLVEEFGLGHGWRLGFSSIEKYIDGADEYFKYRLILSDGRAIRIDDNVLEYPLDDLQFSDSRGGYDGAAYTLTYADGKKEYFDGNGRNIAIVDRYGNEITIEYTVAGSRVTSMEITDTVGNVVVFADVELDLGDKKCLQIPGISGTIGRYNMAKTLSLNGEIIRTYYSYAPDVSTNGAVRLMAVRNEFGENTRLETRANPQSYNCFVSTPTTSDSQIYHCSISSITQPNGMQRTISAMNWSTVVVKREIIGSSGYQETDPISSTVCKRIIGYNMYAQENYVAYVAGDYSGYYSASNQYTATETLCHATDTHYILESIVNEYTFNGSGNLTRHKSIAYDCPPEDEFTGDFSVITRLGTASVTDYTYGYPDLPLPSNVSVQIYEPGDETSYMAAGYGYMYDTKGNVTRQTNPNGQIITFTWHDGYNIPLTTTYTQKSGTQITETNTLTADNKSIASSTVTSNGTVVSKTTFGYDSRGRVTSISAYGSEGECSTQQLQYGSQAQATRISSGIVNADGVADTVTELLSYNARGLPTEYTDGNGERTIITYDAAGRIVGVRYPNGGEESYAYDRVAGTVTRTDVMNNVFVYKYDYFGRLIEIYDNTTEQALVSYDYDSFGQKIFEAVHSIDSTKDKITYWEYDELGRVTETGSRDSTGAETPLETYSYQANLGKTTHTILGSDGAPDRVETSYVDNMGNMVNTGRMLSGTEYLDSYEYDHVGNCVKYKSAYTASVGGSFTQMYEYDYRGNVLSAIDAEGNVVENRYDWRGWLTEREDALGNVTSYTYDGLGRLVKTTSPIDSITDSVVKYYYDGAGNVTRQLADSEQKSYISSVVEYDYDSMGDLVSVRTPLDESVTYASVYARDLKGNLLSARYGNVITMLDGEETLEQSPSVVTYTWDHLGNVLTETDALGNTASNTWDINGNVLSSTDGNGVVTQYAYDNRGRLTAKNIGSGSEALNHTYTYALNGLLLSESLGDDTVSYTYDELSRLRTETQGALIKQYTHNIGNLVNMIIIVRSGRPVMVNRWSYDTLGRMTQMSGSGMGGTSVSAGYTYDANSNPLTVTYGNGVQQTYTYNVGNLAEQISVSKDGATLLNRTYSYDYAGRQLGFSDGGGTTFYEYDRLGRLTGEIRSGTEPYERRYTYDSRGNRVSMLTSEPVAQYSCDAADDILTESSNGMISVQYSYDAANRLVASSEGIDEWTYTWDGAGNMLTETGNGTVSRQYSYNAANQLVEAQTERGRYGYAYHPGGLRKAKLAYDASGAVTGSSEYAWSGGELILESSGGVDTRYYYGLDLVAGVSGASMNYYSHDAHGSVLLLTNEHVVTVNAGANYSYDAFGNILTYSGSDNPFLYSGEYYDAETGNYYLRARYYTPGTGRFTQRDTHWNPANMIYGDNPVKWYERANILKANICNYIPDYLAIVQSGNLHVYAMNDPVQYKDENGEFGILATLAIGAGIGALVNGAIQIIDNVRNGETWTQGLGKALLSGAASGAISTIPIAGMNPLVTVAVTGAAGNLTGQLIAGEIKSVKDVVSALGVGAATGLVGKGAADLLSFGFQEYFKTLTKAQQKAILSSIGNISNRELTAIRQAFKSGMNCAKLNELVVKYGYDVVVSAFVSSTTASSIQ